MRVVDDLADEVDAPIRKLERRLIRVINCAIDAVAETEIFREPNRDVVEGGDVAACADVLDQLAVVFRGQEGLDFLFEAKAAAEVGLLHAQYYPRRRPRSTARITV